MDSRHARSRHGTALMLSLAALLSAGTVQASGARQGVRAQPGEMVLLRDVPSRPAYRPAPPGVALIAETSPRPELASALGTDAGGGMDELSDSDFAGLGSSAGAGSVSQPGQTTVERVTGAALGSLGGRADGTASTVPVQGLAQSLGGPMGAVGNATGGIANQVRGALAQFPMLQQPTNGGGP